MTRTERRLRMAKSILDFEARRDKHGRLMVYQPLPGDGGGRYEVAGINEKYNKTMCDRLVGLVNAGKFDQAEHEAEEYIASDTDQAMKLTNIPSIESYLRDCVFNRGARGATKILQMALGVDVDGQFGERSNAAMRIAEGDPNALLLKLRKSREDYERDVVGVRPQFWNGLVSRWDKALVVARTFSGDVAPDATGTSGFWQRLISWILSLLKKPTVKIPQPGEMPSWLLTMRQITGTLEAPGDADNPVIMAWCDVIAKAYPEMKDYCAGYKHDSTPWCGLTIAYVLAKNGIRPQFGTSDLTRFLWAASWAGFGTKLDKPRPGAIMVFTRAGGGHVSLFESETATHYVVRGGNQSDSVNVTSISKSKFTCAVWPS